MFSLPDCYSRQRNELLQSFDERLKSRPGSISRHDLDNLQIKIANMNRSIQTYFIGGLVTSGVVLWNIRGVKNLSPAFKVFSLLTPPLLFPLYSYLTSMQRIQAYEAFLAIKYNDFENEKKASK